MCECKRKIEKSLGVPVCEVCVGGRRVCVVCVCVYPNLALCTQFNSLPPSETIS